MDLTKRYLDIDGNKCSILEMIEREPSWVANRLQEGEKAIEKLKRIKALDTDDLGVYCEQVKAIL